MHLKFPRHKQGQYRDVWEELHVITSGECVKGMHQVSQKSCFLNVQLESFNDQNLNCHQKEVFDSFHQTRPVVFLLWKLLCVLLIWSWFDRFGHDSTAHRPHSQGMTINTLPAHKIQSLLSSCFNILFPFLNFVMIPISV